MSTTRNQGRELGNLFAEAVEILDDHAGLATAEAQMTAAWLTCMVAMRMRYSWASLRVGLAGCPELLAATGALGGGSGGDRGGCAMSAVALGSVVGFSVFLVSSRRSTKSVTHDGHADAGSEEVGL